MSEPKSIELSLLEKRREELAKIKSQIKETAKTLFENAGFLDSRDIERQVNALSQYNRELIWIESQIVLLVGITQSNKVERIG